MQLVDRALGDGDQLDAGEAEVLVEPRHILLIA